MTFEKLPEDVLARARSLPLKPDSVVLRGNLVSLVPSSLEQDAAKLFAVSNGTPLDFGASRHETYDADEKIWRFLFEGPYANLDDFGAGLRKWIGASDGLCFTVHHNEYSRPVGIVNYMRNHPEHLRIEVGGIWYSPIVQRTGVNTEAIYLLLRHAFDLGYRRIEWKCHSENIRSRNAALRLGFTFEGIQEDHMIWKESSRDTAWFRMLAREWPGIRETLEGRLIG